MKKLSVCLLLFLSAVMVFAGCAGANGYLKTATTTLSASSFYHNNYLTSLATFQNVGSDSSVIYTETNRVKYSSYVKNIYEVLPEERCLISALDYLCEINSTTNTEQQKTKVKPYEYKTVLKAELNLLSATQNLADNYLNTKAVVLLERADKTSSLELTAYLFYMDVLANYEIADLQNNVQNAHYAFTFVQTGYNVQTNTFSLKYASNCTASASYNLEKGCLNYSIKTYLGTNKTEVLLDKSIYKYANGSVGVRVIVESGSNPVVIYEQSNSEFYKVLKVGEVKDKANIISMETMPEGKLGVANSSDDVGFAFTYDLRDDTAVSRIICENYGLND